MSIKYYFREYEESDYNFIYNLKKLSYKGYVEEFFGEWNEEFQSKKFCEYMENSLSNIKIIMVDKERIGFVEGYLETDEKYEIGNICLLPSYQGKGIGSSYLNNLILENSNRDIYLGVFKTNPARKLYERFGFKIIDETNSHYLMIKDGKFN